MTPLGKLLFKPPMERILVAKNKYSQTQIVLRKLSAVREPFFKCTDNTLSGQSFLGLPTFSPVQALIG